jgi:hypothetical protein
MKRDPKERFDKVTLNLRKGDADTLSVMFPKAIPSPSVNSSRLLLTRPRRNAHRRKRKGLRYEHGFAKAL